MCRTHPTPIPSSPATSLTLYDSSVIQNSHTSQITHWRISCWSQLSPLAYLYNSPNINSFYFSTPTFFSETQSLPSAFTGPPTGCGARIWWLVLKTLGCFFALGPFQWAMPVTHCDRETVLWCLIQHCLFPATLALDRQTKNKA